MQRLVIHLIALWWLLCTTGTADAQAERRIALLIGNQDYSSSVGRLKNPGNDIALVADALRRVGFKFGDITMLKNAGRVEILNAVGTYADNLASAGPGAIGFLYYSGHGAANKRDGQNYLIPVGVSKLDRLVWFKAVPLGTIISRLKQTAPDAAHFVIFDACRNKLNLPAKGGKGFAPVRARRGMLIAFSTDPGATASDEGEGSGPYAKALAEELTRSGQDHLSLFQNVKEKVFEATGTQVPWERNGLLNRIYLADRSAATDAPQPVPNSTTGFDIRALDLAFWNDIKDSQDAADFEDYLRQFPKGVFAGRAKRKLERLKKKVAVGTIEKEVLTSQSAAAAVWEFVKDSDDRRVLRAFIRDYGNGSPALRALALDRLSKIPNKEEKAAERNWNLISDTKDPRVLRAFLRYHSSAWTRFHELARQRLIQLEN